MLKLIKNSAWLQTFAARVITSVHPAIEHNIQKIAALKRAFYLCNLEGIQGDYLEFGMFEGTSFIGAFEANKCGRDPDTPKRAFHGYDSFEGFKYFSDQDKHPFFLEGAFKSSYQKTRRRITRHLGNHSTWSITPGYVEQTVGGKKPRECGIEKIAIVFIDLDLGSPARVALNFVRPALQPGSILIFDDFFAYCGSLQKGVAGAFEEFRHEYPELQFRHLLHYGYGGAAFMLADIQPNDVIAKS